MKKIATLLIIVAANLVGHAQEEKNMVVDANAEVRKVGSFKAIEVSGAINLFLSQGTEEAVAVSASGNDVRDHIRTEVKNGRLMIFFDDRGMSWKAWGNHKMKAYVTFKQLTAMEASGASNIRATDPVRLDELLIVLSGASDFRGPLQVKRLRIDASGASNATPSGTAAETMISASGACNIRAYELRSDKCNVDASGASNIRITVEKELKAEASGGSTIFYRGSGLISHISSSGGASIKRRTDD